MRRKHVGLCARRGLLSRVRLKTGDLHQLCWHRYIWRWRRGTAHLWAFHWKSPNSGADYGTAHRKTPPTAAPTTHSPTTQSPTDAPTTQGPSTQSPTDDCVLMECPVGLTLMCDGTGDLAGDLTRQRFCNDHCRLQTASCTTQLCSCTCKKITCKAVGGYEGSPTHDDWCQTICTQDSNLCPDHRDQCQCTEDL